MDKRKNIQWNSENLFTLISICEIRMRQKGIQYKKGDCNDDRWRKNSIEQPMFATMPVVCQFWRSHCREWSSTQRKTLQREFLRVKSLPHWRLNYDFAQQIKQQQKQFSLSAVVCTRLDNRSIDSIEPTATLAAALVYSLSFSLYGTNPSERATCRNYEASKKRL